MKEEKLNKDIIAIIVDGGLVQGMVTNGKKFEGVEFMVIDYDTDGAQEETIPIYQGDEFGDFSDAYVFSDIIGKAAIDLKQVKRDLLQSLSTPLNEIFIEDNKD